ncbi:MAG: metallophosphoesterase, partial [Acidobacteriota bacterium]|nr:metallophosphoesterase [Acidobacteriota bacterium]
EVGAVNTPVLQGNPDAQPAFLAAAQKRYPRMANFSFDYGNAHWTVLDSNPYVDWTNPARVAWIANDLAAAKSAQWRFVAFHHPGFNSSKTHFQDQWMRVLSEVFEAGGVDIVFSGHVHNYQRTFPMRFTPEKGKNGGLVGQKGLVGGVWKLDKQFDDGSKGKPNGVIYLITGAGGAGLYNTAQQADRTSWQEFTQKYIADQHSFTVVDVNGSQLKMKQISETGAELDSFQITK